MKIRTFCLLLSCFILTSCATRISGKLVDISGTALTSNGATVNISDLSGQIAPEILEVNEDGQFESQADLAPGEYYVEVLAPGYVINALRVKVEKSRNIIFKMKKSKTSAKGDFELKDVNNPLDFSRANGSVTLRPPSL